MFIMNKKPILISMLCASSYLLCISQLDFIKNSTKNIFDDREMIEALSSAMRSTNASIDSALKQNKSDSLEKIYIQIKLTSEDIIRDLTLFSANLVLIKKNNTKLNEFRKNAMRFSQARDKLKQEISNVKKFKEQNEKAFLRSDVRKEAKRDIADALLNLAETFVVVSQKAINDFAAIDASLFMQEKMGTVKPAAPAVDAPRVKKFSDVVQPIEDIDEAPYPYLVTPALKDMPKQKPSALMKSNEGILVD